MFTRPPASLSIIEVLVTRSVYIGIPFSFNSLTNALTRSVDYVDQSDRRILRTKEGGEGLFKTVLLSIPIDTLRNFLNFLYLDSHSL